MARSTDGRFYSTKQWKRTKEAYLESVNHLCEECLKHGQIKPAYIVHHKKYLTADNETNPDIAIEWNNLEAVCLDCHNKIHHSKSRRWNYKDGRLEIEDDAPLIRN